MCIVYTVIFFANLLVYVTADELALLAGTLKTFQRYACDGSTLELSCPNNTSIDILHANYGDASLSESMASRCPVTNKRTMSEKIQPCTFTSLMYSTTQRVFELCHTERQCKIPVQASTFTDDEPCPHHAKYLEVAFKCRPAIFINKIICEDELLLLNCGPRAKIAIYSVFFGRTKDGSLRCPQPDDVPEADCQASFAYEIVMKKCHGYHACEIKASNSIFENPCPRHYNVYMKAAYACVPSNVLKSRYGNPMKKEHQPTHQSDSNSTDTKVHSELSKEELINCTVTILAGSNKSEVGLLTNWMRAITFINKNIHTFILYLVVGACIGALLCLLALVLHFWRDRNRERNSRLKHHHLTSTFSADYDDTDGDVDLMDPIGSTRSYSPPQPLIDRDVRFYTTPRPPALADTDLILPRSLSRENHQYLYS